MEIKVIEGAFSVCRLKELEQAVIEDDLYFLGRTDEEISLVCRTESVPQDTAAREDGWRAFRIQGELDFSLIGILAGISAVLAENKIGIFVVSTYNTDYVLTKADDFERALGLLESRGYGIARQVLWHPGTDGAPRAKPPHSWPRPDKMDVALGNVRNKGRIYDILMSCFVW